MGQRHGLLGKMHLLPGLGIHTVEGENQVPQLVL